MTEHLPGIPAVAQIPQGAVVITPTEVFQEMRAIHLEVKEMRVELRDLADHENRIRTLERKVWVAFGTAIPLGGGLGTLLTYLLGGP